MSVSANGSFASEEDDWVPILKPDASYSSKLKTLSAHFSSKYKCEASFFVRVPGRVNLIGEHIDYCGYAVCPMAIKQHVLVAIAASSTNQICLTNVESKYKDFRCDLKDVGACIDRTDEGPSWYKYFLCGVKGALEVIPQEQLPTGILAAVWGNIPPNAGLSSSSALVSAALLSMVHANQIRLSKAELADISARAERHIGTQGGGMDQAIAFLGKAGSAKLIEFNPLRVTDVTLPENAVFVIAHSQVSHNKALTSDFNLRVVECRLAAQVMARKKNVDCRRVQRLIDLQKSLEYSLEQMVSLVTKDLHEEAYTLKEICDTLDTNYEQLAKTLQIPSFRLSQTFKLQQRALHVFQEASRVLAFQRINKDTAIQGDEKLCQLGKLMLESHRSLCKLYECSHPRVDALVDKAMSHGALGARLTGAGWGGCIVAITTKNQVSRFVQDIRKEYHQVRGEDTVTSDELVFPTEPNQGAAIYVL